MPGNDAMGSNLIGPALCVTSGSDTIRRLNTLMVEKRGGKRNATVEMLSVEWII